MSHESVVQSEVTTPIKTDFTCHGRLDGYHASALTYCALVESILYSSVYLDKADMGDTKGEREFSIKDTCKL